MPTDTRPPGNNPGKNHVNRAVYRDKQRQHKQQRREQSRKIQLDDSYPKSQFSRKRFRAILAILVTLGLCILAKLFYVQVIDADNLKKKARVSRNQALSLYNRGRIIDRNGTVLAQDTILYDLFAHPAYFHGIPREDIAQALAPAIARDERKLLAKLKEPYSTIGVRKNLKHDEVERIAKLRIPKIAVDPKTHKLLLNDEGQPLTRPVPLPGLDFSRKNVRNYPQGNLAAHILGYANDEAGISSGIESSAAAILKKRPVDLSQTILDGRGNLVALEGIDPSAIVTLPKAADVQLTLDSRLQYVAERELAAGIARSHAKRGTVIMMDPRTGEILAFAVMPTYQPDQFYKSNGETLKNWAVTDVYPPGSTFKILTVASGLETGVINRDSRILDTGKMKIGGWTIQNYDYGRHGAPGYIDLIYLLMHSSNIASAKISLMMPIDKQFEIFQRIGIGKKTGIELPGESNGLLLPSSAWKDESTHASLGYGYGMAATPMQIASGVAAIANGGTWHTPYLMKDSKIVSRRIFSAKTCEDMRYLLTRSIQEAKTSTVRLDNVEVAGKTGTSRKPNANGRGYSPDVYTSFVGFFPAKAPKVLMMVVVDSPQMAESWGSTVAGPIFKNIAEETVSYLGLMPGKIGTVDARSREKARRSVPGLPTTRTPTR